MSRLAAIYDDVDDDGSIDAGEDVYTSYRYLGAGRVVEENYEQADVKLSYLDSSDNVTGFDRFGRVVDQVCLSISDLSRFRLLFPVFVSRFRSPPLKGHAPSWPQTAARW